jgi:hypothetical protein
MRDRRRAEMAEARQALRAAADYRPDPTRPPVVLTLPFPGCWLAATTPARRVPSHGTHFGGQTYAILRTGSIEVRRGDRVTVGQPIAR